MEREPSEHLSTGLYPSPYGIIRYAVKDGKLQWLQFDDDRFFLKEYLAHQGDASAAQGDDDRVTEALTMYFEGKQWQVGIELAPEGTEFQHAVWASVRNIPYGTTTTYADIAVEIGRPDAVRAVGAAIGKNPILILIPCHRVLSSHGSLTGYAGGLEKKLSLLRHEDALLL
ncbi:MAG: cysteine methyltransferase [Ectothiorhodospiraceae bacterium]|nr:cysteine methyltransferase [Ectothiorhodospiraceae bacterium]